MSWIGGVSEEKERNEGAPRPSGSEMKLSFCSWMKRKLNEAGWRQFFLLLGYARSASTALPFRSIQLKLNSTSASLLFISSLSCAPRQPAFLFWFINGGDEKKAIDWLTLFFSSLINQQTRKPNEINCCEIIDWVACFRVRGGCGRITSKFNNSTSFSSFNSINFAFCWLNGEEKKRKQRREEEKREALAAFVFLNEQVMGRRPL